MPDWTRIREVFEASVERPKTERQEILDRECAQDQELRNRVEELLDADQKQDRAMIETDAPVGLLQTNATRIRQIGPYEIIGVLGAGGMGTVFEAKQEHPRRSVAVKVLRSLLATPAARQRLEYEGETLARLHHPGIAQIYDAGSWQDPDSGESSPYFAMEYVAAAKPLDLYAEEQALDLNGRIELFLQVCDAVQHGHQIGILHRDLKPANMLVGADGLVKVIDFGIARAVDSTQDDRDLRTISGQVLGTLVYMSPEQLAGSPATIDVRADVYALGATLYELCTGRPPHERGNESLAQFIDTVQSRIPAPASSIPKPGLKLTVELDWILLKALEHDRERRYASTSEFAADLRRLLRNQPVIARPPTTGYLLRKFVRRHRALVGTVAAAGLLLLVTSVIAILGWVKADRATQTARLEADTQAAVTQYMLGLIGRARVENGGREITMVEVLEQSEALVGELAEGRLDVAASMRIATANSYLSLKLPDKALPILRAVLDSSESELGANHPQVLSARHSLGLALSYLGEHAEAANCLSTLLALRLQVEGPDSETVAETRQVLGSALLETGDLDRAEGVLRAASAHFRNRLGPISTPGKELSQLQRKSVLTDVSLALVLRTAAKLQQAEAFAEDAWNLAEASFGSDDPATATAAQEFANILSEGGKNEAAADHLAEVLNYKRRVYGADHPDTLTTQASLGAVLKRLGRMGEALTHLQAAWAGRESRGERSVNALVALFNLAVTLESHGSLQESEEHFKLLFELSPGVVAETQWLHGQFRKGFGTCLRRMKKFPEAEVELLAALAVMEAGLGPDHPRIPKVLVDLVELYQAWGRPAQAEPYARRLERK